MDSERSLRFEQLPSDADVPVFVIDGYDPLCGLVLQQYANRLEATGNAIPEELEEIRKHARYMQEFYNGLSAEPEQEPDEGEEDEDDETDPVEATEEDEEPDLYFGDN